MCRKLYISGAFRNDSEVRFSAYTNDFFSEESRYYKWKVANKERVSMVTIHTYRRFLENQLLPYFSNMPMTKIKRSDIKEWVIWANGKWSPKTVNSAQTVLNIIFKQAVDEELIAANPCSNLAFRTIRKKCRELLTLDEVRAMYHSGKWWHDNRTAFLLDVLTGLRISELVALRDENVHDGWIDVSHSYSPRFGLGPTKTRESRKVPIPDGLALPIRKGFLFVTREGKNRGKPLSTSSFYDNTIEVYDFCGINYKERGLTVHTNRNFFNSYLESQNVPEPKIRAVMGHKDASMTNLYTYWTPEMFPEIYQAQERLFKEIVGAD